MHRPCVRVDISLASFVNETIVFSRIDFPGFLITKNASINASSKLIVFFLKPSRLVSRICSLNAEELQINKIGISNDPLGEGTTVVDMTVVQFMKL